VSEKFKIENLEKYSALIKKLDQALDGEEIDDVIPALISFLAMAGAFGGVNKRLLLSYFAEKLDEIYSEHKRRAC
jgi:hypothetical protein